LKDGAKKTQESLQSSKSLLINPAKLPVIGYHLFGGVKLTCLALGFRQFGVK